MFQEGYDKTVAKEFYSAEGYSIGSGFRLGFGLGLGMLALSTVTTIVALAASTIDERQVEKWEDLKHQEFQKVEKKEEVIFL